MKSTSKGFLIALVTLLLSPSAWARKNACEMMLNDHLAFLAFQMSILESGQDHAAVLFQAWSERREIEIVPVERPNRDRPVNELDYLQYNGFYVEDLELAHDSGRDFLDFEFVGGAWWGPSSNYSHIRLVKEDSQSNSGQSTP